MRTITTKPIMIIMILTIFVGTLLFAGCTNKNGTINACTADAKICPDGSAVGRQGPNCEFALCPNNSMEIANPASKYCVDNNGTLDIRTANDGSQTGYCTFPNGVECEEWTFMRGECPAKANVTEQCDVVCEAGYEPYKDVNGCGCRLMPSGKLQAIDCPQERTQACTREYVPVCGQVQVQCIKAPCPPIKETFSNKCVACANSLTISYTDGACAKDNAQKNYDCVSLNGTYDAQYGECAGITSEQCTTIGGVFNECGSACRHDPNATMCTMQCIIYCDLSKT